MCEPPDHRSVCSVCSDRTQMRVYPRSSGAILPRATAPSASSANAATSKPVKPNRRDAGLRSTRGVAWKPEADDQLAVFMNSEGRSSTGSMSQS